MNAAIIAVSAIVFLTEHVIDSLRGRFVTPRTYEPSGMDLAALNSEYVGGINWAACRRLLGIDEVYPSNF
jgi:hypothetical protein